MITQLKTFFFTTALLLLTGAAGLNAQIVFTGKVIDALSHQPIPYATVAVLAAENDEMVTGTSTAEDGRFRVIATNEHVYLDIRFIGYEQTIIREFEVKEGVVELGSILLRANALTLDEAEVTAERSMVEFKLDKRVFNVGKDISSTGMGALDVLSNVPSVTVDIEGEVSLRGNAGVQILINGKPSVLSDEGAKALSTITADMIDRIEVITNPSAKYEAGGTAGIINIVLKKEEKKGLNGSISTNLGVPANQSVGGSMNYRTEKLNLFTQFGGGYRSLPHYNESINIDRSDSSVVKSEGVEFRNEVFFNFLLGTDIYLNQSNTLTISGNYALELEDQPSQTEFSFYTLGSEALPSAQRTEVTSAINPKWSYDVQYEKAFNDDDEHKLQFSTLGRFFGKELTSEFVNQSVSEADEVSLQETQTNFFQSVSTHKLDYVDPIIAGITLESGAQYESNDVGNEYAVSDLIDGLWIPDSSLTNTFKWSQQVLGVYSTLSYEDESWGVKVGLRVEHTDVNTFLVNTAVSNDQNYTNFFPTLHTSFNFTKLFSMQAGYSRRIFRPRLWDLNPFFNIRNTYNIRQGNPDLQPEFADSYELTGIVTLPKASVNASVYHLFTTEVIERVSFFSDNVNITRPENVGSSNKTGFEFNGKYDPVKWMSVNGDFNYGIFTRTASFQGQDLDFSGDQWSSRVTAKVKLSRSLDLEVSGNAESSFRTVQGVVSGFAFMDLGLRKKLWEGKGVLNVSVRDVFASRIRERVIERDDFYLYDFSQRGRFITFGFSYSFGKGEAMTYSGRFH